MKDWFVRLQCENMRLNGYVVPAVEVEVLDTPCRSHIYRWLRRLADEQGWFESKVSLRTYQRKLVYHERPDLTAEQLAIIRKQCREVL